MHYVRAYLSTYLSEIASEWARFIEFHARISSFPILLAVTTKLRSLRNLDLIHEFWYNIVSTEM